MGFKKSFCIGFFLSNIYINVIGLSNSLRWTLTVGSIHCHKLLWLKLYPTAAFLQKRNLLSKFTLVNTIWQLVNSLNVSRSRAFSLSLSIDSSILPWRKSVQSRKYLCIRMWPLNTLGQSRISLLCYIVGLFTTSSQSL